MDEGTDFLGVHVNGLAHGDYAVADNLLMAHYRASTWESRQPRHRQPEELYQRRFRELDGAGLSARLGLGFSQAFGLSS